jgi:glycosyltransferase involved in cell wall biosynthesis
VRVLVDQWESHTAHDEDRSRELLGQADAVLCEWGLGNAVWYSQHVRPGQALTVRVHSQELFTPYLRRVRHDAVGRYVFVSELVRRAAVASHGVPGARTVVVPNMVDTTGLALPKTPDAATTIGFVGMVPQSKRLDLALDVLEAVRALDPAYRLAVRGRRPEEYPWLQARPAEVEFYAHQLARVDALNEARPGSVVLSPHGPDMAEWYRSVGTVLSVSDFESFHLTIADGVASGAVPAVLLWPGADLVYPRSWISGSVEELAAKIVRREPAAAPADVAHLDRHTVAQRLLEVVSAPAMAR